MRESEQVPAPTYNTWTWFKWIAIRFFPPVLLWDIFRFGINKWFGEKVGELVLPAQSYENRSFRIRKDWDDNANQLRYKKYAVMTHDGVLLDTLEVQHLPQDNPNASTQRYIINFVGNSTLYEHILDEMTADAKDLNVNVVGFNLRGVGQSSGKAQSSEDLVIDGIAQVQRLLDKGVAPQNIILKGHSIGGAIASLVAWHFHQIGQPIYIFNGRSFSTLTDVVVGLLCENQKGILGFLWRSMVFSLFKFALVVVKWEINASDAFKNIPEAFREYIVVRSRRDRRTPTSDDRIISYDASIHAALRSERRATKAFVDEKMTLLDQKISQAAPADQEPLNEQKKAWLDVKHRTKGGRKMEPLIADAHNISLSSLRNRYGKDAQTFFKEFVTSTHEDALKNTSKSFLSI